MTDPSTSPSSSPPATATSLELRFKATVSRFISTAITAGDPDQLALFGPRGDGKTQGALGVTVAHAQKHHEAGGSLPTKWLCAADTFESHRRKTHESLMDPMWRGLWELRDGGHIAECRLAGQRLTRLHLFGLEDQASAERVRAQAHGLWFEEPAPAAVLVQSAGINAEAWALGVTSCRLPSYRNPKIMTANLPDEDHWCWRRFVTEPAPGTAHFIVPKGETYATEAQLADWTRALSGHPSLLRRLIEGKPGMAILGQQVAYGFSEEQHVRACQPTPREPLWIGLDGGESHTWCSVIGQRVGPHVNVLAALVNEPSGARQHLRQTVLPWLGEHAPWTLERTGRVRVVYDPACDTEDPGDVDSNPLRTCQAVLPGQYRPGPVTWPGRLLPMHTLLAEGDGEGGMRLRINPTCRGLIKALAGGWYLTVGPDGRPRKDTPHKPNHPHEDFGDAFCYLLAGLTPQSSATPGLDARGKPLSTRHRERDYDVFEFAKVKR